MNAVNQAAPAGEPDAFVPHAMSGEQGSLLSALVDGELSGDDLPGLLERLAQDESAQRACRSYQLIGDALRGSLVSPTTAVPPHAFVAGVRARLQAQSLDQPDRQPAEVRHVREPAANDEVFRWKLVAGAASLAAVFAVSWSVIGGVPQGTGGQAAQQLALTQPSNLVAAPVQPPVQAVVVNTPQGPVLRDARLQELLAEHRQYGGMSALQMPAGFLRDATYQTAPQR